MTSINWLHLSDLHRGLTAQRWLWPNVEAEFFEDFEKLHKRSGPWDMVLFTGDLTQKGKVNEFDKLNKTLERFYGRLNDLGSKPLLLAVPGNHDLERPSAKTPAVKLLREWIQRDDIQDEFWRDRRSPYRRIVEKAFASYNSWSTNHPFPKPADITIGLLPGDFATTVAKDGLRVGVVGLNITFLQLSEGDYEKKLAVSALQLNEVCGENYDDWFRGRDINLLMTHQPPTWLNPEAKSVFDSEIYKPGRFTAHLFGHMHEHQSYGVTMAGVTPKRYWQGCSLFGLETYGTDRKVHRRHGYTAGKVEVQGEIGRIHLWPRKAEHHQAGHLHIVPDSSSTLTEDESIPPESFNLRKRLGTRAAIATSATPFRALILATETDLSEARGAIADHLRRALGVEATHASAINALDPSDYDLVVLIQGWWWDGGGVAKLWEKAPTSRRLSFVVNEASNWPPRRLTELAAGDEIGTFRSTLSRPNSFDRPEELPEKVGAAVTRILQSQHGDDRLGLKDWERAYISFRLPAWKSGRTALSPGHLQEENAEELYQADLYIALDGTSRNWQRDPDGRPKKTPRRRKKDSHSVRTQSIETRVSLGRWLSVSGLPRVALVGAPGGGKTVVLTRTAAAIAHACLGRPIDFEPDIDIDCLRHRGILPVPVVLEATRMARLEPLDINALTEAMIEEMAASGGPRPSQTEIQKGLKGGRYLLLIDALDEIADSGRRSQVLDLIKGMAGSAVFPETRIVLTTRSARYTGRLRFAPELETVEVAPLSVSQVRQLCDNWSRHRGRDSEYTNSLMTAVSGLAEQVGSSTDDQSITENPLMLTAICMVFERYRSLPDDRGRLCELLIDDLCRSRNSEDLVRGWKLDDATKKDLLQRVAHAMQEEGAQTWPVSRAIEIATSLVPSDEKFKPQRAKKYLDWAADHTGLLRFQQDPDGEEQIRFWHRLFREYLCASRLAQVDKRAVDMVDQLWLEKRLESPFWEDVIRLLPRTLGTIEKAKSLRQRLEELARENEAHRGRLLGLAVAGIIENRDLYPEIRVNEKAAQLGSIYEAEGLTWSLPDRLLFLEGLGRLDPKGGDPRLHNEKWVLVSAGSVRLPQVTRGGKRGRTRPLSVEAFAIAWAPVTVQEYAAFIEAPDFGDLQFRIPPPSLPEEVSLFDISLESRIKGQLRHPNWPVTSVSRQEALNFCRWRTIHRSDGKVVRLPTDEEWVRIKNQVGDRFGSNSAYLSEIKQLGDVIGPVGVLSLYLPQPLDFPGRVYQWCDPAVSNSKPPQERDAETSERSVFGGFVDRFGGHGDWRGEFVHAPFNQYFYNPIVGFRCVLGPPAK